MKNVFSRQALIVAGLSQQPSFPWYCAVIEAWKMLSFYDWETAGWANRIPIRSRQWLVAQRDYPNNLVAWVPFTSGDDSQPDPF
jgi:hypothetical protein